MALRQRVTIEDRTAYAVATLNTPFAVPAWAVRAIFHWNITAVAGTTPIADLKFQIRDPADATVFEDVTGGAMAQKTAASYQTLQASILSGNMRAVFVFDRTTGNETYTFTLIAEYLGA